MAWILKLKKRPPPTPGNSGRAVYLNNCAACHREDRSGSGRMPAFGTLGRDQIEAVIGYLRGTGGDTPAVGETSASVAVAAPAAALSGDRT